MWNNELRESPEQNNESIWAKIFWSWMKSIFILFYSPLSAQWSFSFQMVKHKNIQSHSLILMSSLPYHHNHALTHSRARAHARTHPCNLTKRALTHSLTHILTHSFHSHIYTHAHAHAHALSLSLFSKGINVTESSICSFSSQGSLDNLNFENVVWGNRSTLSFTFSFKFEGFQILTDFIGWRRRIGKTIFRLKFEFWVPEMIVFLVFYWWFVTLKPPR